MRIHKLRMNVFVKFHYTDKVLLELLQLSFVCSDHFFLLVNDFCEFVYFPGVKINSVLKVRALLSVLSFLWLILILFLNFLYQLAQVSIFLCDFSHRSLIIKLVPILFVMVFWLLDLRASLVERKLAVFESRNLIANYYVFDGSLRISPTISHFDLLLLFEFIDFLFIIEF